VFFVSGSAKDAVIAPVAALRDARQRGGRGETQSDETGASDRPQRRQQNQTGGVMAAQASEPANDKGGDQPARGGRGASIREAMAANPDAERKMVLVMVDDQPAPRPVLVGLASRTQAEILYGVEPGDIVVTGEAQLNRPATQNNRNDRAQRPAGIGRRGPR
jgi:macrolide-specific efflux system membrane fusion protein